MIDSRAVGGVIAVAVVAIVPLFLGSYWVGLLAEGICFAIAFLSFTLVTGEGGMIWLCQVSFAGLGAVMTAYFVTDVGMPVLLALVLAAVVVAPGGMIVGFLTTRLGDLYVALVTLTFGILVDNLILSLGVFEGPALEGIGTKRPSFAVSNSAFLYLALAAFCVIALVVEHLRRSTAGMAMTAVRWSEPGARSLGISVVQMKVLISGVGSLVAALGGGMIAISVGSASPATFTTIGGLVWLAVLVSFGIRSNVAALAAGITFVLLPGLVASYLPISWAQVPPALFGLGAILLARNPDGLVAMHIRQVEGVIRRFATSRRVMVAELREPGYEVGLGGSPDRSSARLDTTNNADRVWHY